jgi:hypothetical protein
VVSLTGAGAGAEGGLPRTGIAVQTRSGVVLVDLQGRVRRSLPGFTFRSLGLERPGQVELRDRAGRAYELRAGMLVRVPPGSVSLAGGYAMRFDTRWTLRHGSRVVERLPPFTHVDVDASGSLLSVLRVAGDGRARGPTVVRDLRTGTTSTLRRGCRSGIHAGGVAFELCGYPYVKGEHSTIVRFDPSGRHTVSGPAERSPHGPAGWWQSVSPAPDGRTLLAQWSGECEVPTAYLVDAASGRLTILGTKGPRQPVESRGLGWSGAAALVMLPHSACSGSAEPPGIYAFDTNGAHRLVYRLPDDPRTLARLWR